MAKENTNWMESLLKREEDMKANIGRTWGDTPAVPMSDRTWMWSYRNNENQQLRETIREQKKEIEYLRRQIESLIEVIKKNRSDG